jgi:hypothetical protein
MPPKIEELPLPAVSIDVSVEQVSDDIAVKIVSSTDKDGKITEKKIAYTKDQIMALKKEAQRNWDEMQNRCNILIANAQKQLDEANELLSAFNV